MKIQISILLILILAACNNQTDEKKVPDHVNDSISKATQKLRADSMKKKNPLIPIPPDSVYTGDYIDKYPNGIIKFRGTYRFGKRHGQWLSFYPNGKAWSEMHYDKGLRHGPNITYYEDGNTRYSGFYKNDQQDSLWIYFDSIGKVEQKLIYKNDKVFKELPLK